MLNVGISIDVKEINSISKLAFPEDLSIKHASPTIFPPKLFITSMLSFEDRPVVTMSSTRRHLDTLQFHVL